jgi:hypothetical protein
MSLPQGVHPALSKKLVIDVADFGPEQGVVDPALRLVDVELGKRAKLLQLWNG